MRSKVSFGLVGTAIVASLGCTGLLGDNTELEMKVDALEAKVAELDAKVEGLSANRRPERKPSTGADPAKENAADVLAAEIQTALNSAEMVVAKKKMERMSSEFEGTRAMRKMRRVQRELEVVGKDAGFLDVEKWYQGKASFSDGKATLLVFWEEW